MQRNIENSHDCNQTNQILALKTRDFVAVLYC